MPTWGWTAAWEEGPSAGRPVAREQDGCAANMWAPALGGTSGSLGTSGWVIWGFTFMSDAVRLAPQNQRPAAE